MKLSEKPQMRRLLAASRGIKSLYFSKASLDSDICLQQCHQFMNVILLNLKEILVPQFSSLVSISYCAGIDKIPRMHGNGPDVAHLILDLCELPLTCRLFEMANVCRETGFYGEFELIINEIKSRHLNKYLYELGKSYARQWNDPTLMHSMIYDEKQLDLILDDLYGFDDEGLPNKIRYFLRTLSEHQIKLEPYLRKLIECTKSSCEIELLPLQDKLELFLMSRVLVINYEDPKLSLDFAFCILSKNIDWDIEILQAIYGYIKALEYLHGYEYIVNYLKISNISKSLQFYFSTSMNSIKNRNVNYREHPYFKMLLTEENEIIFNGEML